MKEMNLEDLFISKLNVLYDVETALVKAIPKMVKAASDPDLKEGLKGHLEETKNHVERLEKAFKFLDKKPKKLKSEAIRGLIKDGEWVIKNIKPETARDAALARAAQYVEHYEMAGYRGAVSWAEELEEGEVASLLEETLAEEVGSDGTLEEVAERIEKEVI